MMSTLASLAWVTVAVGMLLAFGGLQASLYFARIDKALTGNWVVHRLLNVCRTITIVAVVLTINRVIVLIQGGLEIPPWITAINGVMVIWLLTLPIQLWRNAVAHEGLDLREASYPKPETQDQREDREFGEVRRELEVTHHDDATKGP